MRVSKMDSARGQLETAVVLYFEDDDPVSIHTLTSAAYGVLCDFGRAHDGPPMLEESLRAIVAPAFAPKLHGYLSEAQNFFKHADRDPDGFLDFDPGHTEVVLHLACLAYKDLTGDIRPVLITFQSWAMLTFAKEYLVGVDESVLDSALATECATMTRSAFFREALPQAVESLGRSGRA